MTPSSRLTTSFRKSRIIAPLHTAGPIAVTHDARRIVTCVEDQALLIEVETGLEICKFEGDTTSITSLCVTPSSKNLVVFTSSNSFRLYDLPPASEPLAKYVSAVRHVPRAHDAPVHVSTIDQTSSFIASGSADGIVKIWDLHRGYITHIFKGHGGVISALAFHHHSAREVNEPAALQLFTGSVDNRIRIFDLTAGHARSNGGKPDVVLEGHVSVPRGISVSNDGRWLLTGGRDSVALIWDLKDRKGKSTVVPKLVKTIPVLERIEALGMLDEGCQATSSKHLSLRFYTGGEQGSIKLWDAWEGAVIASMTPQYAYKISDDENFEGQREIVSVIYVPGAHTIVSLHADQNILFHSLVTHRLTRQLIGFNDEITDTALLCANASPEETHLALATNSSLIRVYSTQTHDARLLSGHSGIILSLDKGLEGRVLASGSKDCTARIWAHMREHGERWGCVAVCEGHTESVGAVAMSRTDKMSGQLGLRFLFTGSQDRTIKMWDLSMVPLVFPFSADEEDIEPIRPRSLATHRVHDKDINSLDVAPNNRLLASGSQDKMVKIFEIEYTMSSNNSVRGEIRVLGVCKGHKRGVWNVRFGKAEPVLATGSGDKTIKLWSLDDFTCLKTFEGHTNSVLRIDFISRDRQLLSTSSDGLFKLWDVQSEKCMATMDNHEDKVWALAVSSDERTVVSAGADSVVTFWQDSTEEIEREKETSRKEIAHKEQDFANYVSLHDYRNAILLALAMNSPGRLLALFYSVRSSVTVPSGLYTSKSITGQIAVDQVLKTLPPASLAKLLIHIRTWNASARTSGVAQTVLHAILKHYSAEDISVAFECPTGDGERTSNKSLRDLIEEMVPYTERHLGRVEKLVQDSWVVDFVLGEMDGGLTGEGNIEDAMDIDLQSLEF